jgi:hypothetical protein
MVKPFPLRQRAIRQMLMQYQTTDHSSFPDYFNAASIDEVETLSPEML